MNENLSIQSTSKSNVHNVVLNARQWFTALLKKWWLIALVGLVGGGWGFWRAYNDRPKYESHLTFALEDSKGGMSGALSLAAEFGFSVGGSSSIFEGDNILALLTSRRIIERVLLSVDTVDNAPITLANYYIAINKVKGENAAEQASPAELRISKVSFPVGLPRSQFTHLQDSVLKNLYKSFLNSKTLKVGKPDKKLNLYEVSVSTYNERFSKVFTDRLINEATSFFIELRTRKSKETLDILEARMAMNKNALNSSIQSRAAVQDANVNPAFQQAQVQVQQRQVDISTYGSAYGEMYKNLELARYEYLKNIPLLQIIDAADYPMERIKMGKLNTAITYAFIGVFLVVILLTIQHIIKSETGKQETIVHS